MHNHNYMYSECVSDKIAKFFETERELEEELAKPIEEGIEQGTEKGEQE